MWLTVTAVCSWCLFAYMVPVVAFIVWRRRRMDPEAVIQDIDWYWDPYGEVPKEDDAE